MSETPRHPIVAAWLIGDTDAGGCISELARELAAVTAKLEKAERDAGRYRWLREDRGQRGIIAAVDLESDISALLYGRFLDAAIDAMKEGK